MYRRDVKIIVKRCVSRWSGVHARQTDRLGSLGKVTAASKRQLARELNAHADLRPCAPVIQDEQISGSMKVTELGQRVWDNKRSCLKAQP